MKQVHELALDIKEWWQRQTKTSKVLCVGVAGFIILSSVSELVK
tara:strand:+ start:700 stop:831 length:132 start_codon:yes stop_codon:yes gene_type:complete